MEFQRKPRKNASQLRSLSLVFFIRSVLLHNYMVYRHIHIMSFSSYNAYKLNSPMTCFQRGFIAQSVEHCTIFAELMGLNPVGASEVFLGFLCNCLSCLTTVKMPFTWEFICITKDKLPNSKDSYSSKYRQKRFRINDRPSLQKQNRDSKQRHE